MTQRLPMPLRDRVVTAIVTTVVRRLATPEFRGRFVRALKTGDPEDRVPVEEVVLR